MPKISTPPKAPAPARPETQAPAEPGPLKQIVQALPDSAIISGLVNLVGSAVVHYAFDLPFDLGVTLTFGAIGTLIGASYGPAKAALLHFFANHPNGTGAAI